ncbi:hypothetical protein DMX83_08325 [Cutibacterium acnes]|uniref:Uncharacterized protein n=1 Tax=Cutibacterium acnes TaxID=1747 RepID=A0A2B7J354_CUTAC|nr:hypothetical protein CPA42_03940 [Cutibacterium acnes]PGF29469.1 hypothetical protein B1B06_03625 [Cutibacterium acnes subsp. acnes]QAZ49850.1 hypothetical protein cact_03955 [Cutibacterium acnes DSM 1897]RHW03881.1 hypothetical protein DXA85_03525 [Propionibacterium sp. KPL2009]TQX39756.1 hypothetical protein D1N51_20225 [Clostridioides difficile]
MRRRVHVEVRHRSPEKLHTCAPLSTLHHHLTAPRRVITRCEPSHPSTCDLVDRTRTVPAD